MFPARAFAPRYYPIRYFPKVGVDLAITVSRVSLEGSYDPRLSMIGTFRSRMSIVGTT